ncbi:MAG: inorganic phosphate transporter [Lentisphaeria bacterium]
MPLDQHTLLILVVVVVIIALIFDFLNGFHDAANAIATIVITRTLTPGQAVIMAGLADFTGYFFGGVAVANTVGKIIDLDAVGAGGIALLTSPDVKLTLLLAALSGAVLWNILTWLLGLPTSSSHALIGGLVGSGVAAAGFGVVKWSVVLWIAAFILVAPVMGLVAALLFTTAIIWLFRKSNPAWAGQLFRRLQLVSAAWYCTGHGRNDAQKTMGVIALALAAGGFISKTAEIPHWVVLSCYSAIALGTMFGGWRIVKTMGTRITKIRAMEGFCAESAAGLVLMATAHYGVPVSTTHVISGAIMGVGTVERAAKVRWVTARNILWSWILTMPLTAIFTALVYWVLHALLVR